MRVRVRRKIPASWISETRFQCSDFRASIVSTYLAIPFLQVTASALTPSVKLGLLGMIEYCAGK